MKEVTEEMKEGIGMDVDMVIEGGEKEKWLGKQKVGVVYSFTILINKFSGINPHFMPMVNFCTLSKQKTSGFLMFSRSIEREQ